MCDMSTFHAPDQAPTQLPQLRLELTAGPACSWERSALTGPNKTAWQRRRVLQMRCAPDWGNLQDQSGQHTPDVTCHPRTTLQTVSAGTQGSTSCVAGASE